MLYFSLFKTYKIKLNLKPDRFYRLPKVTRELTRFKNLFNIKIEKYIFVALRKNNLEMGKYSWYAHEFKKSFYSHVCYLAKRSLKLKYLMYFLVHILRTLEIN